MRREAVVIGLVLAGAFATMARVACAQSFDATRAGVAAQHAGLRDLAYPARASADSADTARSIRAAPFHVSRTARPYAPLASALVPGSGQIILGQDRFVVYAAVEVFSWWAYAKNRREQAQQEDAFKSIASGVARAHFTSNPRDTLWAYYEAMRDWKASGYFSKSPTGPIQPETDTSTYNGYHWQLALRTHPTVEGALAEYQQVAVRPEFQWSWVDAQFQFDVFVRTTEKRNDAHRSAVRDLAIIGANHMLSLIDAFTTVRLELLPTAPGGGTGAQLRATLPW